MKYRACNNSGSMFVADERRVRFGTDAAYAIAVTPRSPDMHRDLVAFASAEDLGVPAFGTWMMRANEQPWRPAGINWRSWWPGRFAPDGTYYLSGKKGDLGSLSGRASYWMTKDGVTAGPFATGTTNIEGIADFHPDGAGGWRPIWQNRGKPIIVDGVRLPIWIGTANWLYGSEAPSDRSVAKNRRTGVWHLVTNSPARVPPCVKEQLDGSLLIAWNGDTETFLSSDDGWPIMPPQEVTPPPVIKPPKPPIVKPPEPDDADWFPQGTAWVK